MVSFGVCSNGVSPIVTFGKRTDDYDRSIKEVLPVALRVGDCMFGNDWTY